MHALNASEWCFSEHQSLWSCSNRWTFEGTAENEHTMPTGGWLSSWADNSMSPTAHYQFLSLWMIFSCPEHEMSFQSHLGIFYLIIKPSDGPGAALYLASNHQVCSFSAKPSSMWLQCCSVTEVLLWYEDAAVYLGDGNGDNVSRYLWFHNGLLSSTTHNIWSVYLLLIIFIHQLILLHVLCDKMSHFRGLEYCSFPVGAPKEKLNRLFQGSISLFGIWAKKLVVITYMVPEVISYTVVLPHNLQTKCFSHDKNLCVQFAGCWTCACRDHHHSLRGAITNSIKRYACCFFYSK